MWIGGYSDWTPAEQREWGRDIEELWAEREQRERTETPLNRERRRGLIFVYNG